MALKFPENQKVRDLLQRGDPARIAALSGTKISYVRDMLLGRRRFTDKVKVAITKILKERNTVDAEFKSTIETIAPDR